MTEAQGKLDGLGREAFQRNQFHRRALQGFYPFKDLIGAQFVAAGLHPEDVGALCRQQVWSGQPLPGERGRGYAAFLVEDPLQGDARIDDESRDE